MSTVKFGNVTKTYNTNGVAFQALNGISFETDKGEFLSIAGPSGSGKTTILNIIGCLDQQSSGDVEINGHNVSSYSSNQLADIRRRNIGFIFQTFNLIPILTAFENVEFPLVLCGDLTDKERKQRVEEIFTKVGLQDFMKRKPAEMSGGQQQRVAIARALVKEPSLILADEPTANLDSKTGKEILDLMVQLNQTSETTFIFSTHDKMVMDYAKRLILLRDGRIIKDEKGE